MFIIVDVTMIKTFRGFVELKGAVHELPQAGGSYTRPKVDRSTIMDAEFVVIPGMEIREYKKEKGGYIPVQLMGKGYHEWIEVPTLQDIIVHRLERDANAPIPDIVDAVFHYLEYDAFKDD